MNKLRIIPLGGLGEIGKNMIVIEYGNDLIAIDAGLMFPKEEMLGVDFVIPDISYLWQNQRKLKGLIITHGHEDHIGALPYILSRLSVPVYATKLTHELINLELKQRGVKTGAELHVVTPGSEITLGSFTIGFFSVCHSIPDAVGLMIQTPLGVIVHSGDLKFDHTPIIGATTDLAKLAWAGEKGVLLLLSDSTYVELPGYTPSETVVTETLDGIVVGASGRVIVTTFASLISRIQQVIDVAAKHNRRVVVMGRSMKELVKVALKSSYLCAPSDTLCSFDEVRDLPHNQVVLLTTGSQGEPTSALVRMANRDHRSPVQVVAGDTVVISATPIPGNEALVNRTIDSLFRQGAQVVYDKIAQVHVHGHGSQEELKLLLRLVKPKFFVPIHGEYRHLSLHARLAQDVGVPKDNIFVIENGNVLELGQESGRIIGNAPVGDIYVNGAVMGKMDSSLLQDRKLLSQDGVVVVTVIIDAQRGKVVRRPCIIMRGFVASKESLALIEKGQDVVAAALNHEGKFPFEPDLADAQVKDALTRFLHKEVRRYPVIIPVITMINNNPRQPHPLSGEGH
ncbi:MAG: ribonuclease J [Chloroflexota bacterium]|nr:ribonuclease J [Chloroflexota bacterium]